MPTAQICPVCSARLPIRTMLADAGPAPSPGNAALCCHCGAILIHDDDMRLRAATPAEQATLRSDPRDAAAIAALEQAIADDSTDQFEGS